MSDVIDPDGFRANVGIVLMHERQVFLGRRTGGRGWQFPQGGVRQGETPEEAAYRELAEEIGVERDSVAGVITRHTRAAKERVEVALGQVEAPRLRELAP